MDVNAKAARMVSRKSLEWIHYSGRWEFGDSGRRVQERKTCFMGLVFLRYDRMEKLNKGSYSCASRHLQNGQGEKEILR